MLEPLSERCSWCFSTWVCWLFMSRRTVITRDISSYHLLWHSGKISKQIIGTVRNKEVVLAGDGRHHSMGHSAKYGTYTMFCCTIGLIIHIVLVQVCMLLCLTFASLTLMVNSIFRHQHFLHYVNWIFCCCFKKLHFHVYALDSFI